MMDYAAAILSAQRAILGLVTPNLRALYVEPNQSRTQFCLHFYYDNPPTEEEEELASDADTEFISDFPNEEIDFKISVLPYPNIIPSNGWCVYSRYEKKQEIA